MKILVYVGVILACVPYSQPQSDWTTVVAGDVVAYELDLHPIQIRSNSPTGSQDRVILGVAYSAEPLLYAGNIAWNYADYSYKLFPCTPDYLYQLNMVGISDTATKTWTVVKKPTALAVYFNDQEVLNYVFVDSVEYPDCVRRWGEKGSHIRFSVSDEASDMYREAPECTSLSTPNMVVDPVFPISYGAQVSVSCSGDYVLQGDQYMTCIGGSLVYATTQPLCLPPPDCTGLGWTGISTTQTFPVAYGSEVTITCPSPYTLMGQQDVYVCKGETSYDPDVIPVCKKPRKF